MCLEKQNFYFKIRKSILLVSLTCNNLFVSQIGDLPRLQPMPPLMSSCHEAPPLRPHQYSEDHRTISELAEKDEPSISDLTQLSVLISTVQDPFMADEYGNSPLHFAANLGRCDSVKVLLQHGHPLLLKNLEGDLPLHFAVMRRSDRRITNEEDNEENYIELAVQLLSVDVDYRDSDLRNMNGDTPLHNACLYKHHRATQALIQHYHHPNDIPNFLGDIPLHSAAYPQPEKSTTGD